MAGPAPTTGGDAQLPPEQLTSLLAGPLLYVAAVRKLLVAGLTNGKVLATDSLSLLYLSRDAKFTRAFDETLSQQGRDVGSPSSWTGRCNAMSGPDASLGEMPGYLFLAARPRAGRAAAGGAPHRAAASAGCAGSA